MGSVRPIVVVTGANAGIGFGICKRLLFQLSYAHPPDSKPEFTDLLDRSVLSDIHVAPCAGLTLVLACRSMSKAEAARKELFVALDEELARRKRGPGYDGHGDMFRANLQIDLQYIDMAAMGSVFQAANELALKYPYISHLICNAGVTSFSHINWWLAMKQLTLNFMAAVSAPRYNVAITGEKSADGLGWVWQCNVFAHYTLFRQLQPMLKASNNSPLGPARVIWMSSVEASPTYYDPNDWQITHTPDVYALSKFQTDILATRLDMRACEREEPVRHIVVQPGVCATNIAGAVLNSFSAVAMMLAFWIARLLGSPHHAIHRETAGYSAVHLALVPLSVIPAYLTAFATYPDRFAHSVLPFEPVVARAILGTPERTASARRTVRTKETDSGLERPARFGTETDRWGNVRLGMTEVREWDAFEEESEVLREKFETLYRQFSTETKREKVADVETFSERALNENGHAERTD